MQRSDTLICGYVEGGLGQDGRQETKMKLNNLWKVPTVVPGSQSSSLPFSLPLLIY